MNGRRSCRRPLRHLVPLIAAAPKQDVVLAVRVHDAETRLVGVGAGTIDDLDEVQLADIGAGMRALVGGAGGRLEDRALPAAVRGAGLRERCVGLLELGAERRVAVAVAAL